MKSPFGSKSGAVVSRPVITVPGSQTIAFGSPPLELPLGITFAPDVTGTVTLSATGGTITLNGTTGLSFTVGDGVGNTIMTFSGTEADINTAVTDIQYAHNNYGVFAILVLATNVYGTRSKTIIVDVVDQTAPILSNAIDIKTSATAASLSVVSDDNQGTIHYVLTLTAGTPTAEQILLGQDVNSDDAVTAGSAGAVVGTQGPFIISGLTPETTYYAHFLHVDQAGNNSNVISGDGFTTDAAADVTAPVLSAASGAETGATTASIDVTTDEGNGTLWWVVTTSATQPSVAQIKAGQNHSSAAAPASGSQSVSGIGAQGPILITGLTASTGYYAHFVQDDAAANTSNRVASSVFTTESFNISDLTVAWVDSTSADVGYVDGEIAAGDFLEFQIDTATTFDSADLEEPSEELDAGEIASGSFEVVLPILAAGTWHIRVRVRRGGDVSAWSAYDTLVISSKSIRNDGSYILRNDSTHILRES